MVRTLAALLRSSPLFELAGAAFIITGVVLLTSGAWGFIAAGVFALLKSVDIAVQGR